MRCQIKRLKMFVKFTVLLLVLHRLSLSDCVEDEWALYESKYKHHNREEIFIANATIDSYFRSNVTVEKWTSVTIGSTCYTGGITNNSMLAILFSTNSKNGSGITIVLKVFNLKEPVSDIEFFQERKNGSQVILLVAYSPKRKAFIWYSIHEYSLNQVWTWPMEDSVSNFHIFKIGRDNFMFASISNDIGINSVAIYGFNFASLERWYHQSIQLRDSSPSSCISAIDRNFYFSITQPASNLLLIYQFFDRKFIPFRELVSPHADQVVCFENGFKSFIAFNGVNAGIYEFTTEGVNKREIVNSNLEGIEFWLPIPVSTYRDETILMCQRKLDHSTHYSFDVDVVTYNGKRFEEHVDIPCSLFGEQQNGLKCLTEYNSNVGMLGSSYIAIANHLALLIPELNSTSVLFNLKVGLRRTENPVKKELESLVNRKRSLQAAIDAQDREISQLLEKKKHLTQINIPERASKLKTAEQYVGAKSNHQGNPKLVKLNKEVLDVINEIQTLKEKIKDREQFVQGGKFETIIFNGPVEIESDLTTQTFDTIDTEMIDLLNDIVRKDELKPIQSRKSFKNLTVDKITFENVNGVPSREFIINNGEAIRVNGSITFDKPIDVQNINLATGLINDMAISKWVNIDRPVEEGPLFFEQLVARNNFETKLLNNQDIARNSTNFSNPATVIDNLEKLTIPGSVWVQMLNGHNFESFLRKLCLNNVDCHIPSLRISGAMNIRDNVNIEYLNGLKFPEEYVGLDPKETLVITGAKHFKNITRGNKVTTNGKINNVDVNKIVNLSGEQHITGTLTFDKLEVISVLNVDGEVKGKEIEKFLPNIGLKETSNINANVQFLNLEVLGDIIIKNNLNFTRFNEYLDNIVVKNENATISGLKDFPQGFTALKNLYISSGLINNISLDSIITKDTNQDVQIDTILGNVDFEHLYVKGLFDGQNITDLNKTLVKLNENQTIGSELIFENDMLIDTLIVDKLIKKDGSLGKINDAAKDARRLSFDQLELETVVVEGNIVGHINNFDLKNLDKNYLKYTKDQSILKPYFVNEIACDEFAALYINNIVFDNIFSYPKLRDNITDILTYRNATVHTIDVEESLNVNNINNNDFGKTLDNHTWMRLHRNSSRLIINGDVYFETLEIERLANTHFDDYVASLIFKNDTKVDIQNSIIFENGIRVKKLIETSTLNDVALEHILRKDGDQTIIGQINILGDVSIDDDVTVKEMINNVEVTYMLNNFDMGEESLKVKGEVFFQRIPYIRNLTVHGSINGKNFNDLKDKFVFINGDVQLDRNILFNQKVQIDGNLGISEDINGIVLSEFVPRMVWLTQDTEIEGPVQFTRAVQCRKALIITGEMKTRLLFGKSFEDLTVKGGVLLNKGLLQGTFLFDNLTIHEDLKTKFINNLDMDTIVPLKTIQQLDEFNISEMSVAHNVDVGNKVNGVNLMVERDRTLLNNAEQYISSDLIFLNNVVIDENLTTPAINNKPTSKIVTLNSDQNLTAAYNFNSKCFAAGHLTVNGLMNGINLTSWKNNAIPVNSKEVQHIKEKWVMDNLNLVGPLNGDGMMNDINITQLIKDIRERESDLCDIEKRISDDFKNICEDITYIYKNAKKQIHKFKYFEELQTMSLANPIHYVKHFNYQGNYYLLVNEERSCFSDLLKFDRKEFVKIKSFHTGGISQIVLVKDGNGLFLVTRGLDVDNLSCNIRFSTVIWQWMEEDMKVLVPVEAQELLEESQLPGTFYGLRHGVVTEFKIDVSSANILENYRKWNIRDDNASFIPRGIKTGLALSTDKNLIFLNRDDPIIDEEYGIDTSPTIVGNFTKEWNNIIPGRNGGDVSVVNVGIKGTEKTLLAVASHKETQVEHRLDIVEIYLNSFTGELFDKILTYRPTALISIEFGNGETLLAFMEDTKVLQIYEYKGIEGFKHRSSIKIQASQMFLMEVPTENQPVTKVLGLVHNNKISLLQAVMAGSKLTDDIHCTN